MGRFFKKCLPPASPYIEFIEPTTTTVAPQVDTPYIYVPPIGQPCDKIYENNGICRCGSLLFNSKFLVEINSNNFSTEHESNVLLENGQKFITSTKKINSNNFNKIEINFNSLVTLKNRIQIIIKRRETNEIIGYSIIGNDEQSYQINSIEVPLLVTSSLVNESLQLEFYSLCYLDDNSCCDKLPSSISLSGVIISLPCTTTTTTTSTTTTLPPFCDRFNLPNMFYVTVVGYGPFAGQEKVSLITRSGNTYSTSGSFPCGANFYLQMSCDPITQKFYYDGYIDCCDQDTKIAVDETSIPLIRPAAILPEIISYKSCDPCAPSCTTSTTSTTTTLPPIPCNDEYYGSLTINGYAFYRNSFDTVNIPGVGPLGTKCSGGHICDRTDFLPKLITEGLTINAQPISLNNLPNGQDIDATFSFNVPDVTLLRNGSSIKLECLDPVCHQGVTWVVLTANIKGNTVVLFNSCILPNEIDQLKYTCDDCCDWDGKDQYIEFACDNSIYSIPFYKIGPNLFEANGTIGCGDTVGAIYRCNPDIKYSGISSCNDKWEVLSISIPCATNPRLTGNILQPCDCNKPPVYEWIADNLSNCQCCGQCPIGDGISGIYIAGNTGSTCWNQQDKNSHLFFSDCTIPQQITIKGLGIVGPEANNNTSIQNNILYNDQNIIINTDNKPKSAIIRTSSPDCISISGIGTRNTGYGQGWSHPFTTDIINSIYNPCHAATPPNTVGGQGAYTLTISDINPSGQYEVHLKLVSSLQPTFTRCPSRCGTYFYVIADNNGLFGSINENIPILNDCGDGPMIETKIINNIENFANWSVDGDCIAWMVEGWIINRDDLATSCRTEPTITILPSGANTSAILEPELILRYNSELDDNGLPIPYWLLNNIKVINPGSGYSECQPVFIDKSPQDTLEINPMGIIGECETVDARIFVNTTSPINPNISIPDWPIGGAVLEPVWKFIEKYHINRACATATGVFGQPISEETGPPKNLYTIDRFNIINGGSGYIIDDQVVINSFPSVEFGTIIDEGTYSVSSVDNNGSILSISIISSGRFLGSLTSSIEHIGFGCPFTNFGLGNKYYNETNCSPSSYEITGVYPTFNISIDGGGSGATLSAKTARRGCGEEERYSISNVIINNAGSGYSDGQTLLFTPDIPVNTINEVNGIIYVDSDIPKNATVIFDYTSGSGAILEPIFSERDYYPLDYFYELVNGRPENPCNIIPKERKAYEISSFNIIDGGIGYVSGDYVTINFNSTLDGVAINGYGPIFIDSVDNDGKIISMIIHEPEFYVYGGSLTDTIGSVIIYDGINCQYFNSSVGDYRLP